MKLDELRKSIQKRNIAGECYQSISISLGISKAMAHQIANGHRPGPEVSAILGLEPSAKILRDRERRKRQKDELIELRKENTRLKDEIRGMYQLTCKSEICIFARPSDLAVKL